MQCSCCDFGGAAERQFTEQIAARDVERYRSKGPARTTRLMRDGLKQVGQIDGVLLDIGAGVGALTFELFASGVTRAVAVDASPAYVAAASREAARRQCFDAIQFIHADFLSVAASIPPAAIVTLDRVICCYPESHALLVESLRHAERFFAFSYPRDAWPTRLVNILLNAKRRVMGNGFRTYVHSAADMAQTVRDAGFGFVSRRRTWTWSVDVYARSSTARE